MSSKDDRPGGIPDAIEERAIKLFQQSSHATTGVVWKWEESCEEIRNIWRISAFIEAMRVEE